MIHVFIFLVIAIPSKTINPWSITPMPNREVCEQLKTSVENRSSRDQLVMCVETKTEKPVFPPYQ